MDDADILKMSGISASGVAIVLLIYRVLKIINGKKIRSRCCGRTMEVGVEVGEMTPQLTDKTLKNPNAELPQRQDLRIDVAPNPEGLHWIDNPSAVRTNGGASQTSS
jgi:hypothetical protein